MKEQQTKEQTIAQVNSTIVCWADDSLMIGFWFLKNIFLCWFYIIELYWKWKKINTFYCSKNKRESRIMRVNNISMNSSKTEILIWQLFFQKKKHNFQLPQLTDKIIRINEIIQNYHFSFIVKGVWAGAAIQAAKIFVSTWTRTLSQPHPFNTDPSKYTAKQNGLAYWESSYNNRGSRKIKIMQKKVQV